MSASRAWCSWARSACSRHELAADAAEASAQVTDRDHRTESATPATSTSPGYVPEQRHRHRPAPRSVLLLKLDGGATGASDDAGFGVAGRLSADLYLRGIGVEPRGIFV